MVKNCFAGNWIFLCTAVLPLFLSSAAYSQAQHVDGHSPNRDTSYTTWSAFISTRKTHPEVQIVPELNSNKVVKKWFRELLGGKIILGLDAFYPIDQSSKKRP